MEDEKVNVNLSKNDIEWIFGALTARYIQIKDELKGTALLYELKMLRDDFKALYFRD